MTLSRQQLERLWEDQRPRTELVGFGQSSKVRSDLELMMLVFCRPWGKNVELKQLPIS